MLLRSAGRLDEAASAFERAIALAPHVPELLVNLGNILKEAGRLEESADAYRRAIAARNTIPEAHMGLGNALADLKQWDQAIASYRDAAGLRPQYAQAWHNLGGVLDATNQTDDAITAYQRATVLGFEPSFEPLGNSLRRAGRFEEAITAYQRAPKTPQVLNNLGATLKDCARLDEAIAAFQQAMLAAPDFWVAHSNLLYTLYFHPAYDAVAILQAHREWDAQHARGIQPIRGQLSQRPQNRRLRLGYVSPDFRDHCQSLFTIPLLSHHNREQFEVYCYADVARPDAVTQRLQSYADTWRSTVVVSDELLARQIADDGIDILVDLTMHMAQGRPLVFARRPAPVQLAWLAYPGTTGIDAIEYRLTDPHLDPPGHDAYYSEKSIRLPATFWCYDPLSTEAVQLDLPSDSRGHVTFGCLCNFCKVNDRVLSMWSAVLARVERSRLILLSPRGAHRQHVIEKLGVDPGRIEFVEHRPRAEYLRLYHSLDVMLDTCPYNGHTTSLDAWWMGVPVVSLCGQTAVSRAGLSQASNLGLQDLVAADAEGYARIAEALAGDPDRRRQLRHSLRERMSRSPLMDAARFAADMEAVYHAIRR